MRDTRVVRLVDSVPCSATVADDLCGCPAYVAVVVATPGGRMWLFSLCRGCWERMRADDARSQEQMSTLIA